MKNIATFMLVSALMLGFFTSYDSERALVTAATTVTL